MNAIDQTATLTVGLLWHSTDSANLGVGALTASHIDILDQAASELGCRRKYHVIDWNNPHNHRYIDDPRVEPFALSTRSFRSLQGGLLELARRCDVVFDIGAGDSFTDLYGTKRFLFQIASKSIVLASGTPLILAPQTIGPFSASWVKRMVRPVLRRCSAVVTRDALSTDFVRKLDPKLETIEATDVAFRLPFTRPAHPTGGPTRVGINVSGLLYNKSASSGDRFSLRADYAPLMRELIDHFRNMENCEVHLVGHVLQPSSVDVPDDDWRVTEQLGAEFENVFVAPRAKSPQDAKSMISTMDFFVGARMHACIAAFSSGVPTIPIAYSRKFLGLFQTLGYPHVADAKVEDNASLYAKVVGGFENRLTLAEEVRRANERAAERLDRYRGLVRGVLMEVLEERGAIEPQALAA